MVRTPAGRLPLRIDELYITGRAVSYDPRTAVDRVEWNFGTGRSEKSESVTYTFDEPGRYPVSLTVRDKQKQETTGTFHMLVEAK